MITIHDYEQGSDEWLAARCGLLTASEMKHVLTPTLKIANNDKTRSHMYEMLAQRITQYVEPHYIGDDMLRGMADEIEARAIYNDEYAPVTECGFITNDSFGYTLGFSPDGLVGDDGFIEIKSRRQKYQVKTVIDNVMDDDYALQVQTGFLVTGRKWCDFISYSAGLPMATIRVYPDQQIMDAILVASAAFEEKVNDLLNDYNLAMADKTRRLIPTERTILEEIVI